MSTTCGEEKWIVENLNIFRKDIDKEREAWYSFGVVFFGTVKNKTSTDELQKKFKKVEISS